MTRAAGSPVVISGRLRIRAKRRIPGGGSSPSATMIAGGSLAGILFAILVGLEQRGIGILPAAQSIGNALPFLREGNFGQIAGALMFFVLAVILTRFAQRKM